MIRFASLTSRGGREVNEDSIACVEERSCFLVCDGLGGHGRGDEASGLVADSFREACKTMDDPAAFLGSWFPEAQMRLTQKQQALHAERNMKTTAVALVIGGKRAYIGHVGDSRAYVFHRNRITYRTLDHSVCQMLVLSGEIREEEIRRHPDRSLLLRVMGVPWEKPMYELSRPLRLKRDQAFLLCSDGFWELINETEMCQALAAADSPDAWLTDMAQTVRRNGENTNMDNYSAIAVWHLK